jgi:hypothetical protein
MWTCEAGGPEVGVEELRTFSNIAEARGGQWESVPGRTPNHRLQLTTYSVRSAPAAGRS